MDFLTLGELGHTLTTISKSNYLSLVVWYQVLSVIAGDIYTNFVLIYISMSVWLQTVTEERKQVE